MRRRRIATLGMFTLVSLALPLGIALGRVVKVQEGDRKAPREEAPRHEDMMAQCPMMAGLEGIELYADDAVVLLARARELGLTERQKEELERIREDAHRHAHRVLAEEQRQKLGEVPDEPLSLMELARRGLDGMEGEPPARMCRMCERMMRMRKEMRRERKETKEPALPETRGGDEPRVPEDEPRRR